MQTVIPSGVAAFRTAAGKFYALFERSTRDGTPKCFAFGTLSQVLCRVFDRAAACETGFLRASGPGGVSDADAYVSVWRDDLRSPKRLFTQPVFLDPGKRGAGMWYHDHGLPRALDILIAHGYETCVAKLRAGEGVTLGLHADAAVLADLMAYDTSGPNFAPDHIAYPAHTGTELTLGFHHRRSKLANVPGLALRNIPCTNHFVLRVHGHQAILGSLDDVFGEFARTVAVQCEMKWACGGSDALDALREQYQDGLAEVPCLEPGAGFCVDETRLSDAVLYRENLATLVRNVTPVQISEYRWAFAFDEIEAKGLVRELISMPAAALELVAPSKMASLLRERDAFVLAA